MYIIASKALSFLSRWEKQLNQMEGLYAFNNVLHLRIDLTYTKLVLFT